MVYLTADQAEIFAKGLERIADAIETGKPVVFKGRIKIPPATAIRNQAGWLRRTVAEQNGGYRWLNPWDFQEGR